MTRTIDNSIIEYVPAPENPKAKLALALYREAMSVNMVPYKFLGYFKVINIIHAHGKQQMEWIRQTVGKLCEIDAKKRLLEISSTGSDPGEYLYVSGRCAVAHAFGDPVVNPDAPDDLRRLSQDLPVIKALARHVIEVELGVQSEKTVWDEHLYELDGFRDLFGPALVNRLKTGDEVQPAELVVPEAMSLRLQGHDQLAAFSELRARVDATEAGVVQLALQDTDCRLRTRVLLFFREERLVFDALNDVEVIDDGTTAAARVGADYLEFYKQWLANGVTEVWIDGVRLGRSDPVIPINMRPDWDALDEQISELRRRGRQETED